MYESRCVEASNERRGKELAHIDIKKASLGVGATDRNRPGLAGTRPPSVCSLSHVGGMKRESRNVWGKSACVEGKP